TDIGKLVDEQVALTKPEDANSADVCTTAEEQAIPTKPEDATTTDIGKLVDEQVDLTEQEDDNSADICTTAQEQAIPARSEDAITTDIGKLVDEKVALTKLEDANTADICTEVEEEAIPTKLEDVASTDIGKLVDEQVAPTEPEDANSADICTTAEEQVITTKPEDATETDTVKLVNEQVVPSKPVDATATYIGKSVDEQVVPSWPEDATPSDICTTALEQVVATKPATDIWTSAEQQAIPCRLEDATMTYNCTSAEEHAISTKQEDATATGICMAVEEQIALAEPEDANSADIGTSAEEQDIPTMPEDATTTDIRTSAEEHAVPGRPEDPTVTYMCTSEDAANEICTSTDGEGRTIHITKTESVCLDEEVTSINSTYNKTEIIEKEKEKSAVKALCKSDADLAVAIHEDVITTPQDTSILVPKAEQAIVKCEDKYEPSTLQVYNNAATTMSESEEDHVQKSAPRVDEEKVGKSITQDIVDNISTEKIEIDTNLTGDAVLVFIEEDRSLETQTTPECEILSVETRTDSPYGPMWKLAVGASQNDPLQSPKLTFESNQTEVTSNKRQTPCIADKKVHWSMPLDALSVDGEIISSRSVSSGSSADNARRIKATSKKPTVTKATGMMECYNRFLAKDGCSGPLGEAMRSFISKTRKDWKYIESCSIADLKADMTSWTASGACFKVTTSQSELESLAIRPHISCNPDKLSAGEARDAEEENVQGGSVSNDKREHSSPIEPKYNIDAGDTCPRNNARSDNDSRLNSDTRPGSPLAEATKEFFLHVGSELKGDGPVISGIKSEIKSWTQSDYCGLKGSPQTDANVSEVFVGSEAAAATVLTDLCTINSESAQRCDEISVVVTENLTSGLSSIVGASEANTPSITKGSQTANVHCTNAVTGEKLQKESNLPRDNLQTVESFRQYHEAAYKERNYLREWKLDAEEKLKCQDAVTAVLREQKLNLIKKCNELEEVIKDFEKWKFEAEDKMKTQSAELENIKSQKSALMKRCDEHHETIQNMETLKSAAEKAIAAQDQTLKQMRTDNSTLAEKCREQHKAINILSDWKIEATETMKNQFSELQLAQAHNFDLTMQLKRCQESIQDLTSWKHDAGAAIERHVTLLKQTNDQNSELRIQCCDQQKSIEVSKQWKNNAEETIKDQLAKLKLCQEQNSNLMTQCNEYQGSIQELTVWKCDAEEKMANQLATCEELRCRNKEALELMGNQLAKLESLQELNSRLVSQCNSYQKSIQELTTWKSGAEEKIRSTQAELEQMKAEQAASSISNYQQKVIELTNWKSDAEERMKNDEVELKELRSHYLIIDKQCREQKELIQDMETELGRHQKELGEALHKASCLKENNNLQDNKIKSYKETIESKSNEVNRLKVQIFKLNELNEQLTNSKNTHYEEEILSMKMAHHKELVMLKTEKHELTSKIEHLICRDKDMSSRVMSLQVNIEDLKNKLQREKERHHESRTAIEQLEKALKVAEKRRRKIEQKIVSDKDFCDILSKRLDEGN
ncbi:hypothetical protein ACHAW6_008514, partial [Cyclotella cf. meneghiniana]